MVLICLVALLSGGSAAFGQNTVAIAPLKRTAADLLPEKLASATATSNSKNLSSSELNSTFGHNLDLIKEYGLITAAVRNYKTANQKLSVTIIQLDTPSHAFGLFTGWGDGQQLTGDYPPQGKTTGNGMFFWQGRYFVQVSDDSTADSDEIRNNRKQAALALSERIGGGLNDTPGIMDHLPPDGLVANSSRYIVGPTGLAKFGRYPDSSEIDFTGGTEVAAGQYNLNDQSGQLIIVEFQTPQFATVGLERMQKSLDALPQDQRDKVSLKREGNYAVQTIGFTNHSVSESLAGKVQYTYTVKWISKPPTSPIDMSSYRKDALKLLIAIFAAIGLAAVIAVGGGILFGRLLFVRRRAQLQNAFSDAGGMIRLNLDDMVPTALPESNQKSLGKGD
jgi:hypothetical protein